MTPDNTLAEVREALKRGCYLASEIGDNLAFHQIEQALAKLDALIEGQGWQPIENYDYETFPLVMLAGFITPSEYAQSNGSKPFWEISIGRCWHVNTRKFTGFLGQQPTHWMPLPKPPTQGDVG